MTSSPAFSGSDGPTIAAIDQIKETNHFTKYVDCVDKRTELVGLWCSTGCACELDLGGERNSVEGDFKVSNPDWPDRVLCVNGNATILGVVVFSGKPR